MVDCTEMSEQSLISNLPSGKFCLLFVIVNIPDGGEYHLLKTFNNSVVQKMDQRKVMDQRLISNPPCGLLNYYRNLPTCLLRIAWGGLSDPIEFLQLFPWQSYPIYPYTRELTLGKGGLHNLAVTGFTCIAVNGALVQL